ncbi:MAG: methyltransferase domain-containing protein [Candidatus Woesearchaeota archaeon]|jgi:SAM-dependent methyltransferase
MIQKQFSGLETENKYTYGDVEFSIPSTGEIGRSLINGDESFLVFTNPMHNIFTGKLKEPLLVQMYKRQGSLRILNAACGGCSDIPLLEELILSSFKKYGISNPKIDILNVDNSDIVVNSLKNNTHPYFKVRRNVGNKLEISSKEVELILNNYIDTHFDLIGKSIQTETTLVKDDNSNPIKPTYTLDTKEETRDLYKMKEEYAKKLKVSKGNIFYLPFEDNSFDVVIALNIFHHIKNEYDEIVRKQTELIEKEGFVYTGTNFLTDASCGYDFDGKVFEKNDKKVFIPNSLNEIPFFKFKNELMRVAKQDGYVFPGFGLYQKSKCKNKKPRSFLDILFGINSWTIHKTILKKVTEDFRFSSQGTIMGAEKGIIPTYLSEGKYVPYKMAEFKKLYPLEYSYYKNLHNVFLSYDK